LAWAHERKQLLAVRAVAESHPIRLVPTFLGAHVVPKGVDRKTYVDQIVTTMIPQVAAQDLARFCDVFMEAKAFTAAETKRILRSALEHGLRTKLHADEFTDRHGAALGVALGCQSVDHLLHIGDDGVKALSSSPTVAVLLPFVHRSSFEARTAPARDLIESGAAVALGTDFNPNNHNPSMLEAFRAAVYDLRMRPAEAMTAATINSAHALAEGRQTGTIEAGKRADFVSWDVTDIEELAYRQGENPRRLSVLSGQVHVA
jgi:imidazolonepropionase